MWAMMQKLRIRAGSVLAGSRRCVERGDKVYLCEVCDDGEIAEFVADNNEDKFPRWYCGKCEDRRSEKFGCALILAEGAMCQDGACGCGGTGVYL